MPQLAEGVAVPLVSLFDPKAGEYARITRKEFQAMMLDSSGAAILTITALTIPDYYRKGCPFKDNLLKLARVNGMLNWVYEDSVNRQRVKEGVEPTFESLPRMWGSHLNKTPFISHVTKEGEHKLYLKFRVKSVLGVAYLNMEGKIIPTEDVEPYLKPKKGNERQGVEQEVLERDYEVVNILAVAINKMGYIIT